jgi:hypothetical protein
LTLWVGELFDFSTPFRAIPREIVDRLSISADCDPRMPPCEDDGDFIEGKINWGGHILNVYYEYSLGFLCLSSLDKTALDRLSAELSNVLTICSNGAVARSS